MDTSAADKSGHSKPTASFGSASVNAQPDSVMSKGILQGEGGATDSFRLQASPIPTTLRDRIIQQQNITLEQATDPDALSQTSSLYTKGPNTTKGNIARGHPGENAPDNSLEEGVTPQHKNIKFQKLLFSNQSNHTSMYIFGETMYQTKG